MLATRSRITPCLAALCLVGLSPIFTGCSGGGGTSQQQQNTASRKFQETKLISDIPGNAAVTDPNLVNPWGVAFDPTGSFWIANNGSGTSTIDNASGVQTQTVVAIPSPTSATGGTPTGQVFNGTNSFRLSNGLPAQFIFSTEDGTIVAWNGYLNNTAFVVADRSNIPVVGGGSVYKGLAIGTNASGSFLYAANFSTGQVDVFDTNFTIVNLPGSFTDPNLPSGYAPFGIQNIGGDIFVTYARQDVTKQNEIDAAGSGIIDDFDTNGNFKRRFATGSASGGAVATLNSPWGMTLAPANFGAFGNALLVGNFGDGTISAFNPTTGALIGQLQDTTGANPITIPGLWSITFGNGGAAGSKSILYFTAGIGDPPTYTVNREKHGLFGSLQLVSP